MENDVVQAVKAAGSAIRFILFTRTGLALVAGAVIVALLAGVSRAVRSEALARASARRDFGPLARVGVAFESVVSMAGKAAAQLPLIGMTALVLLSVAGVAEIMDRLDESARNERRIRELSLVVRNLERRTKVAEIACLGEAAGNLELEVAFFRPGEAPGKPAATQRFAIRGREVYLDAVVFNFAFSEIEAGREVNLAIPYRVFTDEIAQADGVPLDLYDARGIPHAYAREEGDVYGLPKETFDRRLGELVTAMRTDADSRKLGIVRSLYGNAVHRPMRRGDVMQVWSEATGGLSVKDPGAF